MASYNPNTLASLYRKARGIGENALSMLTSGFAEPAAGYAAAAAAATGYDAEGAGNAIRERMTYAPKTAEGVRYMSELARVMSAVNNSAPVTTWKKGVDIAGRYSPAAGAALQTVPAALGALTGYKQAMQTGNALSQRLAQAQRVAMDNAMQPRVLHPQRGVFAGINAKTADLKALESAKQMTASGVPADEVWLKTGWGVGADGKWRFEIDDSASYMRGKKSFLGAPVRSDLSMSDLAGSGADMRDIFQHQALFDAYPELKNTQVSAGRFSDRGGDYSPVDGSIRIADNLSGDNARSVMLHEIQHAIQEKEGFQGGGSANDFMDVNANDLLMKKAAAEARINEINGRLRSAKGDEYMDLLDERRALIPDAQIDDLDILEHAYSKYMRLMGETEARNVQARMNMGREERMRVPPIKTEDRARNLQIRIHD